MPPAGRMDSSKPRIEILGPPVISMNRQLIKINRREQRAGLFYLAGHMDPVSREEICDTFWPEDSEETARKKLREGLSRLRSAFNDPDLIISNNDFVSLDPDRVSVDARDYNALVLPLLNSSEMRANGALPEWMYAQLRKAMELCRGHQFLQDVALHNSVEFETWVTLTNQSFTYSREKIVERLAEHCIALGNIDEAILWLGRITTYDFYNTDVNYLMLNCLRERRRFKDALDYIKFLEPLYQANIPGGFPAIFEETRRRLLREDLEGKKEIKHEWPGGSVNQVPFIGRSQQIIQLINAIHRKGVVQVTGGLGCGKTRLVQEFYLKLEFKPRLLLVEGNQSHQNSPYSTLVEGLQKALTDKEISTLPPAIVDELRILLPSLFVAENWITTREHFELLMQSTGYLKQAFLILFESLSRQRSLLCVIDNAQESDEQSLDVIQYLIEQSFFDSHGLLVIVSRDEDKNKQLDRVIDRAAINNCLKNIKTPPFSLEETSQMITSMMGVAPGEDVVSKLHSLTGGNPFFLIETLKVMKPNSFDENFIGEEEFVIPETIRALAREKVRGLSQSARSLISIAAVLGRRFQPEVLEAMIPMESMDFINSLEELQQAAFLTFTGETKTEPCYEFLHEQFRQVLLEELSPMRMRELHQQAVKAYQKIKGEPANLAATYAWHHQQAGDKVKAFKFWCAAGRYARKKFSRQRTYAAYQSAFDLLNGISAKEFLPLYCQLLVEWGDYAYDQYDAQTCETLFSEALKQGESMQDAKLIGMSFSGLGRVAEMRGQIDAGLDLHHRALSFFTKSDCKPEMLETYGRLGILFVVKDEYFRAEEAFKTGLAIEKNSSDQRSADAAVNLETQLALLYCMMGKPREAEKLADQAVNESLLITRMSGKVHAYTLLAMAQYYSGKYTKSIQNAKTVYELAEQLGLDWWICLLDYVLARDYLVMGRLDESWHHVHHAVENKDPKLLHKLILTHHAIKGDIFRMLGDYASAEEEYRLGALAPLTDYQSLENHLLVGSTLCQMGNVQAGLSVIEDAVKRMEAQGLQTGSLPGGILLAAWGTRLNTQLDFESAVAPIVDRMKETGRESGALNTYFISGLLAMNRGELQKARMVLAEVSESARSLGHKWIELGAMNTMAELCEKDAPEQVIYKRRTREILEDMAAHATRKPLVTLFRKFRANLVRNSLF